jgi:Fic family protein
MCDFANGKGRTGFIHPVVKAILLHFWLAYDHPFVDGNGRTARALFYWSMARDGYWLCEFLSISRIIKRAPAKYAKAFLYTETDDNDATYFILNQLRVIERAIEDLHQYLTNKAKDLAETRRMLDGSGRLRAVLNHRQVALVHHALRHPGHAYTVQSQRRFHNVSYQTARTDLLGLARLHLLEMSKSGRAFVFDAPPDLRDRLDKLARGGRSATPRGARGPRKVRSAPTRQRIR